MQIAARVCKAILFFLEQDPATQYRPDPRFRSVSSIISSASSASSSATSSATSSASSATTDEMLPVGGKARLLLWTHRLLRALQQRTWGDGERVLLQLVRRRVGCEG